MSGARDILLLGGTGAARELANRLVAAGHHVTTSLAGRTRNPDLPSGEIRFGGFGGAEGLAHTLIKQKYGLLIDATHPFAEIISTNATTASHMTQIPLLRLECPPWTAVDGDHWLHASSTADAARMIEPGARALVTVGRQEIKPFLMRDDINCLLRMIEDPNMEEPPHATFLKARPPFSLEQELSLLRDRNITVIVTKNAGGTATRAKLDAARNLALPVIVIARPKLPAAQTVTSIDDAICWIENIPNSSRHG